MEEKENNKQIIDIFPLNKGKRVLLFLADFFITFIISFLLYNVAVYPIWNAASNYNDYEEKADTALIQSNSLLKDTNLIYFEDVANDISDINSGLSYTFELYLKEYVSNDETKEHDVFKTYYVERTNGEPRYYESYVLFNEDRYFDIDVENKIINLKTELVTLFNPILSDKDGLSEEGNEKYEEMFNKFFLTYYSRLLTDIKNNDLKVDGKSYCAYQAIVDDTNNRFKTMVVASSFIAYALGIVICYILIPCVNKYHKTIAMLAMRVHRVDIDTLRNCDKKASLRLSLYTIFTNLAFISFLSIITINIEYMFNLTLLLWVGLASLLIQLVSLIGLFFKKSNQTLIDSVNNVAYITNDSFDEIVKARGYYI